MGARQRKSQEFVLVEVASAAGAAPGPTPTTDSVGGDSTMPIPARRALARLPGTRRWWLIAAGLTVVVAASVVASDVRERVRVAALADVPGVLAPLDGPVAERWRVTGAQYTVLGEVSGRLLAAKDRPDGGGSVVALEPPNWCDGLGVVGALRR